MGRFGYDEGWDCGVNYGKMSRKIMETSENTNLPPVSPPLNLPPVVPVYPSMAVPLAAPASLPHTAQARWVVMVLFLCVLLGLLASWAMLERKDRMVWQEQADQLKAAADMTGARANELGALLADRRTVWVGLSGGVEGSIAFNKAMHRGYLFCRKLPILAAGQEYAVVAVGAAPHTVLQFTATPGQSTYLFNLEDSGAIRQFQLLAGPPGHPSDQPIAGGQVPAGAVE